jgi:hypothetical protein
VGGPASVCVRWKWLQKPASGINLGRANLCILDRRSLAQKLPILRYELCPRVRVGNCGCFCKTRGVHSPEDSSRHLWKLIRYFQNTVFCRRRRGHPREDKTPISGCFSSKSEIDKLLSRASSKRIQLQRRRSSPHSRSAAFGIVASNFLRLPRHGIRESAGVEIPKRGVTGGRLWLKRPGT